MEEEHLSPIFWFLAIMITTFACAIGLHFYGGEVLFGVILFVVLVTLCYTVDIKINKLFKKR